MRKLQRAAFNGLRKIELVIFAELGRGKAMEKVEERETTEAVISLSENMLADDFPQDC